MEKTSLPPHVSWAAGAYISQTVKNRDVGNIRWERTLAGDTCEADGMHSAF